MVEELFEAFEDLFEGRKKKKKKEEERAAKAAKEAGRFGAQPPATEKARVFCISCGTRNEGDSRFCGECGELLPSAGQEMRCIKCEAVLPLTAKFCGKCGAKAAV